MADVQAFLTRKAGPLPVWGWAAIAGGAASILYLRSKGAATPAASSATDPSAAAGSSPFAPSPIIVTPGNMPAGTSSANPVPPPVSGGNMVTLQGAHGVVWVWSQPGRTGLVATLPNGTSLPSGGPPVQGQSYTDGVTSNMWVPVRYAGVSAYVWAPEAQAGSGGGGGDDGMGGGSSVMSFVPGSGGGKVLRHTTPHVHPQFLGLGGGGHAGGHAGLQQVSKRTGVPMVRLMALNPGHVQPRRRRPFAIHIR